MLDLDYGDRFCQFELWKDCNNHCKFCFDKGLPDIDKLSNIQYVKEKLNDPFMDNFNEVGFIGGEFFDNQLSNPEVKKGFYEIFEIISNKHDEGKIKKLYITTSLIFPNDDYLNEFLDFIDEKGMMEITLLCTSYDTIGRFHTEEREGWWKMHMKSLRKRYPNLKLHTEIIVTQDFIDKVLRDEFDIKGFIREYDTSVDYLEPNTGSFYDGKEEFNRHVPNFLPTRSSFIRFLKKTCVEDKSIELFKLFSKKIRSDMLYLVMGNEHVEIKGRHNAGRLLGLHMKILPRFGYIDSEIDMLDDVNALRESYEQ